MGRNHLLAAAQRILDGDDSKEAAGALKGVLLRAFEDDERFDDLLLVLALYAPGQGGPYADADELRAAIDEALTRAS